IGPVLSECARVLKPFGRAHFVVTHPFLVAQSILHELYKGIPLGKLSGPMNYKSREAFDYHFTMSNAKARFYQKTFEDYVNSAYSARLAFTKMIEMRTDDPRFEAHPRYWYDRDIPKYLYFS